ncbi:MAG: threonine synthase, partial [Treponema sp.]|nr:threonine synthase [Treponema sp.]
QLRGMIRGAHVSDDETRKTIAAVHGEHAYFLDPHGAVGWRAVDTLRATPAEGPLAVLATAHPAKFAETVEPLTGPVPVPSSIQAALSRVVQTRTIPAELSALVDAL